MKTSFSALARLRRLSAICRSFDHESDSLLTRISDETQLKSHTSRIMTVNILQDKIAHMILIFTIVLVIYSMVIPCICDASRRDRLGFSEKRIRGRIIPSFFILRRVIRLHSSSPAQSTMHMQSRIKMQQIDRHVMVETFFVPPVLPGLKILFALNHGDFELVTTAYS